MKIAGDILKEARTKAHLTIEAASNELKIHPKFLNALENSDYSVFSDAIQIKGFIKNYSKFLNLDESEVLAFWRREYKEDKVEATEGIKSTMKPLFSPKITITPSVILSFITIAAIFAFLAYLFFQYKSFAGAPFLAVESPSTDISIESDFVDVFGRIDKDSELFLNGQRISLGTEGTFALTVSLSEGVNTLNFKALNKLGKESLTTRTILVNKPKDNPILGTTTKQEEEIKEDEPSKFRIEIEIIDGASWISVIGDNETIFPGALMLKGVKAQFQADNFITITAGNAGVVKVYLNGEDQGLLGENFDVVEKTYRKD